MKFIIIPVILIFILVAYLKHPTTRGKRGENKVKRIIQRNKYTVNPTVRGHRGENKVNFVVEQPNAEVQCTINDLILTNGEMTSQIDHIVINPRGVFVIETKNYSGRIYGSENQREWTQVLAYGKVKNKFYNPLKQNATHVYNVKRLVGDLPVHSLVVFVKNNTRYIEANNVIPLSELKRTLLCGENVLSYNQIQTAYDRLMQNKTDISTKQHVQNIRTQQRSLERGVCPRCGGNLVLRKGQFGEFFGCSNYPQCKFVKKD